MDTQLLKSIIVLNGDTVDSLAEFIGISRASLSDKLNAKRDFTQKEIKAIKTKYALDAEKVDLIFFAF